jgi:phosphoglycolate phosphatase
LLTEPLAELSNSVAPAKAGVQKLAENLDSGLRWNEAQGLLQEARGEETVFWKAVIFDLDGTLLDTLSDLSDAMNRVLHQMGFATHSTGEYRRFVGNGALMLVKRALPQESHDEELVRSCLTAFLRDYGMNWMIRTRPYDGVSEMLDTLVESGFRMAILSNKPDEITKISVRELLSKWTFDAVIGQRDGVPLKPEPTGALEIAELLHIQPSECVYLGDSPVDMETAIAAGMLPVGVLWGFRSQEELLEGGARVLIREPTELLGVLEKL